MSKEETTANAENVAVEENSNIVSATAEVNGERVEGKVEYEMGENLDEMSSKFGEETVRDLASRSLTIKLQSAIRRELQNGVHPEDLQSVLGNFDPNETSRRDPKSNIIGSFNKLSEEEKERMLAALKAQLGE